MTSEKEQKFIDAANGIRASVGEKPLEGEQLEKLTQAIQILLPIWDIMLPLIVADIVKAIKQGREDA